MPYKAYSGTTGRSDPKAGNQVPPEGGSAGGQKAATMSKAEQQGFQFGYPIKTIGQDVVMHDVQHKQGGAVGAAGKKYFPQKFAGVVKNAKPVPNSIKRKRINFRLRKLIVPKSPLMVLNEMVGAVIYTFVDNPPMPMNPGMPHLFTAQCSLEGEAFQGSGPSKQIAKNICAEHAIQHVVTKKCTDPKNKAQMDDSGNPLKPGQMEDETPWVQLASLALFKLFNDWQAQGYNLPTELLRAPDGPPGSGIVPAAAEASGSSKGQQPAKKLPDNPTDRHPVQLLNELRGGVSYNLTGETGTAPNVIFTLSVEIDGKQYCGVGRSKKDAKKHCAMEALKALYDIQYPGTLNTTAAATPMATGGN